MKIAFDLVVGQIRMDFVLSAGPVETDMEEALISFWKEVQNYFEGGWHFLSKDGSEEYIFDLDVSDVVDYLIFHRNYGASDDEKFNEVWDDRVNRLGRGDLCGILLTIEIKNSYKLAPEDNPYLSGYEYHEYAFFEEILSRFIQKLFLAANLSCPGSFTVGDSLGNRLVFRELPQLFGDGLVCALQNSDKDGWPAIRTDIPFKQSWEYLHSQGFFELDVAKTPLEKSLFLLLKLSKGLHEYESEDILQQARILEALFVDGRDNIQRLLNQRMELVLGAPQQNKKWFSKLYDVRSRIAHGGIDVTRPGVVHSLQRQKLIEPPKEFYTAMGVIIAALQDLLLSESTGYEFDHTVKKIS